MIENRTERNKLMKAIQTYSFLLTDVCMYLDAYPDNKNALEYYDKYRKMFEETVSEYEKKYGPVTPLGVNIENGWTWIEDSWPWEYNNN